MAQYVIEGPDGSQYIIEGPDGLTEGGPSRSAPPLPPTALDTATGAVKEFGADMAGGLGKYVGGGLKVLAPALPGNPQEPGSMPNAVGEFGGGVEDYWKEFGLKYGRKPGYGKTIAEAVGGGIGGGAVSPTAIVGAAGSGAGSELAANLFGDNFLSRLLGGLVGGFGTTLATSRVRNTQDLAGQAVKGIDDETLARAKAFQAEQAGKQIDIDLAQALEAVGVPRGNLASIRDFLANNPQGEKTQKVLRNQPGQLSMEADQFAARLPGTNYGQSVSANNVQEAASKAINAVKQQRSAIVNPMYGMAGVLTPAQVRELDDAVAAFAAQDGMRQEVKSAVAGFRRKLSGESEDLLKKVEDARTQLVQAKDVKSRMSAQQLLAQARDELDSAKGKPVKAADVSTWIGEMVGPYKPTPQNPVPAEVLPLMKKLGATTNEKFKTFSPEIRAADAEFRRLSETLVNPVKQSVTGQIATPRMYRDDVQAQMGKFDALMQRGTDANAKISDIRTLGTQLAKVDKDAFADALKSYVSRQIKAAMEPGGTAKTAANNDDMAARIGQNLWGNELKAQGLRDAVEIAARTQGANSTDAVRGLNNLIQLVKSMESRPPRGVGGMLPDDIVQTGGKNMVSTGLRAFGIAPFATPANKSFQLVLNSTMNQFDTILTSPDGAKMLAALGRESVMSKRIPFLLGQFGAQVATNPAGVMPE